MTRRGEQVGGDLAISLRDIRAAARRLRGRAVMTPLLAFPQLDAKLGFRLFVKAETFQRTGSFKFRGAANKLLIGLARDPGLGRVVAYSSGNHAQGVAAAARDLGLAATIVMPRDAPRVKIDRTRALGARIVLYDRRKEDRAAIAGAIAAATGALIVPPYDDPAIMAGQGTIGLEILAQAAALGARIDDIVVPVSGGGLIAGIATAVKSLAPRTRIHAAEPAGYDDLRRSLAAGQRRGHPAGAPSICDALMSPLPGELTFPIHRALVTDGWVADDDRVLQAMALAAGELKLILEPGGAVALAAALRHRRALAGRDVVVIASGGNVDPELLARALRRATEKKA